MYEREKITSLNNPITKQQILLVSKYEFNNIYNAIINIHNSRNKLNQYPLLCDHKCSISTTLEFTKKNTIKCVICKESYSINEILNYLK